MVRPTGERHLILPFDIACIGTSLTTGPNSGSWQAGIVARLTPGAPRPIITYDLGYGGWNSRDHGLANIGTVARLRARVVLIEFIMNDANINNGISVAESQSNHQAMIDAIKAASPGTQIYLMTMNPTVGRSDRPNMVDYNAMYQSLAASNGIGFIDNYPLWDGATTVEIPDGIHPTAAAVATRTTVNVANTLAPLIS